MQGASAHNPFKHTRRRLEQAMTDGPALHVPTALTEPFSPGVVVSGPGSVRGGADGSRPGWWGRGGPVLVEMCILLSRGAFHRRDVQLEVHARVQNARLGARGGAGRARLA